jgi:hypothetical protein
VSSLTIQFHSAYTSGSWTALIYNLLSQAELIIDADGRSLPDPDGGCQRCTAAFLARAARAGSAAAAPTTALAGVTCRRLSRTRAAISVAASGTLLILAALLCVRLSAAFIPLAGTALRHSTGLRPAPLTSQPPARHRYFPPAAAAPRPFGCGPRGRAAAGSVGPAMCNPVATPVDPAVSAMLLSVFLSRAGQGLERLGLLPPTQAQAEEGQQPEHAAASLQDIVPLRVLRAAAARPAAVALALKKDCGRGTATLVRFAAAEAVRIHIAPCKQLFRVAVAFEIPQTARLQLTLGPWWCCHAHQRGPTGATAGVGR